MDHTCPECGAPLQPRENCQTFFESLLFEEHANPERNYVVHLHMVTSFMLTHDRYSDEARPRAIELLRIALEEDPPVQHLRRMAKQLFELDRPRSASILRREGEPRAIAWPITVRDVALHPDEDYVERVTRWARSVLDTLRARGE